LKGKQDYQLNPTLSDGTSGGVEETSITIQICKYLVDDWILVKEE
jgi:threonine dehydratase